MLERILLQITEWKTKEGSNYVAFNCLIIYVLDIMIHLLYIYILYFNCLFKKVENFVRRAPVPLSPFFINPLTISHNFSRYLFN